MHDLSAGLRQLQCLDIENIPNVTDDLFDAISGNLLVF